MMKVAFVCVHNSCRSQMAEGFMRVIGHGLVESCSAGTEEKDKINPQAVEVMKEVGIDLTIHQSPKLLAAIGEVDVVVTMGCNVACPFVVCKHREDWGLEDPTGHGIEAFRVTRDLIHKKVVDLCQRIEDGQL